MRAEIKRVIDSFKKFGIQNNIVYFEKNTKTAKDAAAVVGCELSQIAKSIVFTTNDGHPVLIVASGSNRIDKNMISEAYGAKLKISSPEFVKQATGFSVGGVTPFGLISDMPILIDESLFMFDEIWIASGSDDSLAKIDPCDLLKLPFSKKIKVTNSKTAK